MTADRSVTIRLRVTSAEFDAAMARAGISVEALAAEVRAAGNEAGGTGGKFDDLGKKVQKNRDLQVGWKSTAVTLSPALIPLAGAAVVVGGALAGMGVSGVLAFKGIQREMQAGTAEGKIYSAGVTSIKGDLGKLEAVAASNVLAGFQQSVHTINADMPSLVNSTSVFSKDLGDVTKHSISGLLGEWKQLTPELQKGSNAVDGLAIKFDTWANGPGGAKFARELGDGFQRAVPFLKDTATAVGHIFEAANNSGALEILDGAVRLFNMIPVDVLKVAVPLATGLALGIKGMKVAEQASLWIGGLSGKLTGLAAAETGATVAGAGMASALGPLAAILIGGYAATQALGDKTDVLANSFATGRIMADQNVTGMQDLTSAYRDFVGVDATSTGALLQFALSSKNLGIGVGALSDQARDLTPRLASLGLTTADVTAGVTGNDDAYGKLIDRVKAHGGATEADITALNGLHTTFANTADAADTTADAVTGLTDKQKKLADQVISTSGQLGIMSDALAALSGNAVDAEQQELRFKDALAGARQQVKDNGTAINDNTVKGRANKEWLLTQISAINSHAEAVGKQTGSVAKATAALKSDEAQLRASATAAGLNKDQVDALIRKYAATPAQVRTKMVADTKAALGSITTLQANIQALRDHKITITTYLQNVILPGLKTDSSTRDSHHATGGGVGDGWFTVGEGNPNTWELGHKQGADLQFYSNAQSKKMRPDGPYGSMPGYAGGTVNGKQYTTDVAYHNALAGLSQQQANVRLTLDTKGLPGVLSAVTGTTAGLRSSLAALLSELQQAARVGIVSTPFVRNIAAENSQLLAEAKRRDQVAGQLAAANAGLAAAEKQWHDEHDKIAQSFTSVFDITSAGSSNGASSPDRLIAALQKDVQDSKGFAAELSHLSGLHLNSTLYEQLAAGGPGSANAQSLKDATRDQVAQINALYKTLGSLGNSAGHTVANALYGPGVDLAKGLVAGLNSQQSALEKTMTHLANVMVAQIRKELKSHSPSMAGHEIGADFGLGIELGVQSRHSKVGLAAARYGQAMIAAATPAPASSGGGGWFDPSTLAAALAAALSRMPPLQADASGQFGIRGQDLVAMVGQGLAGRKR